MMLQSPRKASRRGARGGKEAELVPIEIRIRGGRGGTCVCACRGAGSKESDG